MAGANRFTRALRRLGASNEELVAQERLRAAEAAGATPISQAADRERVRLHGFITTLTIEPRSGTPWLEATFSDGSEAITLIWMGRREIPGVTAGRELAVSGRLSFVDGERRIYNPHYTLIAAG